MNIIHEIRKTAGMSQAAFAGQLEISQSAVSQYERGEILPDIKRALRIVAIGRQHNMSVAVEDIYIGTSVAEVARA